MGKTRVITLVSLNFNSGGAEKIGLLLSNYFLSKGYKIFWIVLKREGHLLNTVSRSVEVLGCSPNRSKALSRIIFLYNIWILRKSNVISLYRFSNYYVGFITLFFRFSNLILREASTYSGYESIDLKLSRLFYRRARRIIANSTATKKDIESFIKPGQLVVIPNPVDISNNTFPSDYRPIGSDGLVRFIMIGRLEPVKRHNAVIKIFSELINQDCKYQYRLEIFGEGSMMEELQELIIEYGIESEVKLMGYVHDVHAYLKEADILVMASEKEGFGNVYVEALSNGKPLLTTYTGGAADIIDSKEIGVFYDLELTGFTNGVHKIIESDCLEAFELRIARSKQFEATSIMDLYSRELIG